MNKLWMWVEEGCPAVEEGVAGCLGAWALWWWWGDAEDDLKMLWNAGG